MTLAKSEGFVISSQNEWQCDLRRFESGGQLYILDLLTSFDIYASYVATLQLSVAGNSKIARSPSLHKCFKYLCFHQTEKLRYIADHQQEIGDFLSESGNFVWISPRVVAAARGPVELLMGAMFQSVIDPKWLALFVRNRLLRPIRQRMAILGKGISVAFVGPDGSGKSFIIGKMQPVGNIRVVYMGDWFFVFQPLYNMLLRIPSPWNRFVYAIYLFEQYVRRLKVLFWHLFGRIVLIDRFPGTNRNVMHAGILKRLNDLTYRLMPKPDLMVLLIAPPETVYKRKQELPIAEISRIQQELGRVLKGTRHVVLDTEQLDVSLNRLLAEIKQ